MYMLFFVYVPIEVLLCCTLVGACGPKAMNKILLSCKKLQWVAVIRVLDASFVHAFCEHVVDSITVSGSMNKVPEMLNLNSMAHGSFKWNFRQVIFKLISMTDGWGVSSEISLIRMFTHWGRDKMAAASQTTLSNAFSWMKVLEFLLRFHWSLFRRVQLTIIQHWFR